MQRQLAQNSMIDLAQADARSHCTPIEQERQQRHVDAGGIGFNSLLCLSRSSDQSIRRTEPLNAGFYRCVGSLAWLDWGAEPQPISALAAHVR